ncbi:MAG: type secretion system protein GspJ [Proteobacteria bacterium]|nr:type secretion system protein GspJ [Pseudomonadota bacterium]
MSRASRTERTQRGFTLLEILVALAIFAIASAIAYSGLNAVASTKSSLDQEIRFWRELGQVFDRMEMDFTQTLPHLLRADSGELLPPLSARTAEAGGFLIELSRHDAERSPVHVVYRCDNGVLSLSVEPINRNQTTTATSAAPVYPLLRNVDDCTAAYLDANNAWRSAWPGDQAQIRPRAIRIRLSLVGRGQFERVYYLP